MCELKCAPRFMQHFICISCALGMRQTKHKTPNPKLIAFQLLKWLINLTVCCYYNLVVVVLYSLQLLGGDQHRLHPLAHQQSRLHDDLLRLECLGDCLAGAAIWLEGSGLSAAHRAAKVHGIAGCGLSGRGCLHSILNTILNQQFSPPRSLPPAARSMCRCWSSWHSTGRSIKRPESAYIAVGRDLSMWQPIIIR